MEPAALKPANARLAALGTTIFTVMSALAVAHDAINLGQGFPDTEGPADAVRAAAEALLDQRNQYPPMPGVPELRAAVAAHDRRFYDLPVTAEQVVVTSGATEALAACLMAVLDPGDEIVLFEPLYDTYLPMVRALGAVPRLVRLAPPDWALPGAALAAAFGPRTKAVLLNSPMNPAGKVFTEAELGRLATLIAGHGAYAICDEVYEHLVFAPARHRPLMGLPGMAERCLRIGSAGKTFSLTGWKVGYVTAPPALAPMVAKAHQNLTLGDAAQSATRGGAGPRQGGRVFPGAGRRAPGGRSDPGGKSRGHCGKAARKAGLRRTCRAKPSAVGTVGVVDNPMCRHDNLPQRGAIVPQAFILPSPSPS